jgi:hypothetical protein
MLIDRGFKTNDIVTIKLSSGEELIARYVSEDDKTYKVSTPLALGDTGQGIGMYPYLITAGKDRDIPFLRSLVVIIIPTDEVFAKSYQANTSKIQVV